MGMTTYALKTLSPRATPTYQPAAATLAPVIEARDTIPTITLGSAQNYVDTVVWICQIDIVI